MSIGVCVQRHAVRISALGLLCAALLVPCASAVAGSVAYTYDTLGRVTKVIYTSGATTTTITYSYDAAGNRTSVVTTTP